jgi:glycosyltransferase involved in cell wall biosynthesis
MNRKTIAIVANSAWNIHHFRVGLIRELRLSGYRVVVLAPPGPEVEKVEQLGVSFVALRHLRRSGLNPLRDAFLLWELAMAYRRYEVAAAFHFTIKPVIYGSLAARLTATKNIATLTGLGYTFLAGEKTNSLVRRLYRLALRRADRVLFHNPDDEALFLAGGLVRAGQSAVVGGSGLDPVAFPLANYAVAIPGRFLFVGRLLTDKGIREYVRAAEGARAQVQGLEFHVAGAPDPGNPASIATTELQAWIDEGTIVYHGEVADVRPLYRQASVVVLPSYREGCPRALLEAAATGRALIAFDVPGAREIVRPGETGWLVPVKDVAALRATLLTAAAAPPSVLEGMGKNGRRLVETTFLEAAVVAVYLSALDEAVPKS